MPKRIKPLSEVKVRTIKPKEKDFKLFDGGGLFLLITQSGGKLWHFKYRFDNKEKKLTLGVYPEVSLLDARRRRDDARRLLANNVDPGAVRKAQKQTNIQETETFEVIAREWHTRFISTWTKGHAETIMSRLKRDIFPWIGKSPIAEIKAHELLSLLRRVESRGALESVHRIRTICGQVFRYAVATAIASHSSAVDPVNQ